MGKHCGHDFTLTPISFVAGSTSVTYTLPADPSAYKFVLDKVQLPGVITTVGRCQARILAREKGREGGLVANID